SYTAFDKGVIAPNGNIAGTLTDTQHHTAVWTMTKFLPPSPKPAAIKTAPYQAVPTWTCLVGKFADLIEQPFGTGRMYPEEVARIDWFVRDGVDIFVVFAKDPAHAAILQQRYLHLVLGLGALPSEIKHLLLRRENVVIYTNAIHWITKRQ